MKHRCRKAVNRGVLGCFRLGSETPQKWPIPRREEAMERGPEKQPVEQEEAVLTPGEEQAWETQSVRRSSLTANPRKGLSGRIPSGYTWVHSDDNGGRRNPIRAPPRRTSHGRGEALSGSEGEQEAWTP
jgi:hypothetical protein